ncbi:MAG TPA: hypothetical protein O0X70_07065 [Methanocorpusculum sp.]|nr:hypothetical protein [Methanocorpusculum sp.]
MKRETLINAASSPALGEQIAGRYGDFSQGSAVFEGIITNLFDTGEDNCCSQRLVQSVKRISAITVRIESRLISVIGGKSASIILYEIGNIHDLQHLLNLRPGLESFQQFINLQENCEQVRLQNTEISIRDGFLLNVLIVYTEKCMKLYAFFERVKRRVGYKKSYCGSWKKTSHYHLSPVNQE